MRAGGCGCKRRTSLPPTEAAASPLSETALVESSAAPADMVTTIEEAPPPEATCGCGHHAAESAAPQEAEVEVGSTCKCQKLLWIRRTHSAFGLVFGAFLVEHMAATALGLRPGLFEPYMRGVHAAVRQTPWLEVLVFLPLVTLIPFGLYLLAKAGLRYNVKKCKRGGKLRFFLQRASAVVILTFLAFHLVTLRNWGPWSASFEAANAVVSSTADSTTTAFATSVRQVWRFLPSTGASPMRFAAIVFYLLGTSAAVYHLSNGLWTGAIAWGLTTSNCSQQRSLRAFTAFGVILMVLGALGWFVFIVAP
jgi:succinate dehydrogenase / fumarate reductase cytochrome b subunit